MKKYFGAFLVFTFSLSAWQFNTTAGLHDFIVADIQDDVAKDGIQAGTSHTFGANVALYASHTTNADIHLFAKAEIFWDNDKEHLDPDHIPFWFDSLFQADGPVYAFDEHHSFRWQILADNKQNTVGCIERQVRQHIGMAYAYRKGNFTLDTALYAGFYYIEYDDDTPIARGYERMQLDDGEGSNILSFDASYRWKQVRVSGYFRRYGANAGGEWLESEAQLLLSCKADDWLTPGATINLKLRSSLYDIERFYIPDIGVPVLPFDNSTLVQTYITLPILSR